jgi:hypothetical protein
VCAILANMSFAPCRLWQALTQRYVYPSYPSLRSSRLAMTRLRPLAGDYRPKGRRPLRCDIDGCRLRGPVGRAWLSDLRCLNVQNSWGRCCRLRRRHHADWMGKRAPGRPQSGVKRECGALAEAEIHCSPVEFPCSRSKYSLFRRMGILTVRHGYRVHFHDESHRQTGRITEIPCSFPQNSELRRGDRFA